MKKKLTILLSLVMTAGMFAGCTGKAVTTENAGTHTEVAVDGGSEATTESADAESGATVEGGAVKTGLSIVTSLSGEDATAEADGTAQADITIVAVTVNEEGVIESCVIDAIQGKNTFSAEGVITTSATEFQSKNELGEDYGMKAYSGIGKEWNEQVAAIAEYAVGKTVEELKNGAVDETGVVTDADLASSATIYIGGFISGIEDAVNNAAVLGASAGDTLSVVSVATPESSADATAEGDGTAQSYATVAAVTMKEGVITSCVIDAVQADITFNAEGIITSDLTAEVLTKNELGDDYGMKVVSSIGKEWNEQVAAFSEYVVGKTVDEVSGIAVSEAGKATDADLAASVTLSIGDFVALIEKVVQ